MQSRVSFEIIYGDKVHQVTTHPNQYANLMMLIYDQFADEEFGDCRGMGKCGTCMVQILSDANSLVSFDRNESTTLSKMGVSQQNIRLSCQLMINSSLQGLKIKVL